MTGLGGRVAIVTGAGRGVGRAHALALARAGASVVVNDLGASSTGVGDDRRPADTVVAEIARYGGTAFASYHDISIWSQAEDLVHLAVQAFGRLDVLVNNAGIVRDRTLAKLTEDEWDAVLRVNLKGHAAPTHAAMAYWRERATAGVVVRASVIHTSSLAGLAGNIGQANYAAAKMGLVALSRVTALEGLRYGVRSNAISPAARTRLSATGPAAPEGDSADLYDGASIAPLVVWLAGADCPATSQVFHISGDRLLVFAIPHLAHELRARGRWTVDELERVLPSRLVQPPDARALLGWPAAEG